MQNDGQEVGERRRDKVLQEVKDAESVDFCIFGVNKDFGPSKVVRLDIASVLLNARRCQRALVGREEVERVLRVLGKVDHPPIGQDAKERSDAPLHDEHPLPSLEILAIKLVEPEVDDTARCQDNDFSTLHQGKAKLLLFPRVPRRDEIRQSGVDTRHGDTK